MLVSSHNGICAGYYQVMGLYWMADMNHEVVDNSVPMTGSESTEAVPAGGGIIDEVRVQLHADLCMLVGFFPRGAIQVLRPARFSDALLKLYHKDISSSDVLTWRAVTRGHAVRLSESTPVDGAAAYMSGFLRPVGLQFGAAAPVESPILPGYAGALHVYRASGTGDFTAAELSRLGEMAAGMSRKSMPVDEMDRPAHGSRLFAFDANGTMIYPSTCTLDPQLQSRMKETATGLVKQGGDESGNGRISLADSAGVLWNFRAFAYPYYAAMSNGPIVLLSLTPEPAHWRQLQPADVAADPEVARMIPAMQFMAREFGRVPTLQEIAQEVRLSPFHFHRRFSETMGMTPKHLLLDCQIASAKQALLSEDQELADIASNCGFAHQSHFTSRFKQATGLTPTRWRRLMVERRAGN